MDIEKTEQEPKRVRKFNRILLASVLLVTIGVLLGMSIDWFVDEKSPYRNIGSDEDKQMHQLQATLNEQLQDINSEISNRKSYLDEQEKINAMSMDEPDELKKLEGLRKKYLKQLDKVENRKGKVDKLREETDELSQEYQEVMEENGSM